MNRHLTETQVRQILGEVCEVTYSSMGFGCLEPTMSYELYNSTFSEALEIFLEAIPDEPCPHRPSNTVATQCPEPGAYTLVPISTPFALRCSANTISSGRRCRYQAWYPATLCEVHRDYFYRHRHLPHGGAQRPFAPHPDDYWPAFRPREQ